MRNTRCQILAFCVGSLVTVMTTGCLGPKVLEQRVESAPAPEPNLELRLRAGESADVLVIYNEWSESGGKVTRRGFYLLANEGRLAEGKRPDFVKPGYIGRHLPIPIYEKPPDGTNAVAGELYAVSSSPWEFSLQSHGRSLAECELPKYGRWFTAKKFFLFPLAAAGDAIGVGLAVPTVAAGAAAISIATSPSALDSFP